MFKKTAESGGFEAAKESSEAGLDDYQSEEFTVMEGFRYRVNNTGFPVYKGRKQLSDYPIIPIGMLDIWRSEEGTIEF